MKRFFIFSFIVLLISLCWAVDEEYVVIRLFSPTDLMIDYLVENNFEIIALREREYLDVLIPGNRYNDVVTLGWEPQILFTESEMRQNFRQRTRELSGYRSYNDVVGELLSIVTEYPNIAALYNIGNSRGREYFMAGNQNYAAYNHHIWGLKVTSNPSLESDKPAVYYNGAHHAREPISVEVVMYILWHLIDNYGTDPEITFLIDNTEIWFIPILNPDGHKIVYDLINTNWRKNIRDNYNTGTINAGDGVDLNRNYNYEWLYSASYTSVTYGGPTPSSEPETTALRNLWQQRHFVAGISYHSYGQYVLFPPGYTFNLISPDFLAQSALASEMALTIPRITGTGTYTAQHSWQLYPANGTCEDDAYCNHGIFAHTLELATSFIPSANQVDQICEDNLEAALILLRRVHRSTLTGLVTDSSTNEPVVAEVFIPGIDNTGVYRTPYQSSEEYGRYFRILLPGQYNVQFSAPGYFTSDLLTFNVSNVSQTVLNYQMEFIEVPGITNVFGGDGFVRLIWDYPEEETLFSSSSRRNPEGFNIYRDEVLLNTENPVIENIYYDLDIVNGESYSYQITVVYPNGESLLSDVVAVIPEAGNITIPDNIVIIIEEDMVILQWDAIENVLGYTIYSSSNPDLEDWEWEDFTTETEWIGSGSDNYRFYRITAVY